jgi:hypothetical protein
MNRRSFFTTAGAGCLAALAKVAGAAQAQATQVPTPLRLYLEMNGNYVGELLSVEGGHATGDVVVEKVGADPIARKHIAGVRYEGITIACGTGMTATFYSQIGTLIAGGRSALDGTVVLVDSVSKTHSRLSFYSALITEFGLPALDAGSKDAAKMTIKFTPELVRFSKGDALPILPLPQRVPSKWLASNFRLKIDGVDCSHVTRVEALSIAVKPTPPPRRAARRRTDDNDTTARSLQIPNLVVNLPDSDANDFYNWHDDFVIKGINGADREKNGTLEFLNSDLSAALFTLSFQHLGIFRLTRDKVEAASESVRRIKAEMYCEQMTFTADLSASNSSSATPTS